MSQDMLPVNTTLSKMTSQLVGLLPKKLMLEVSGLDAGKFRIVQLPSIWICEGGTGLTNAVDHAAVSRQRNRPTAPAPGRRSAATARRRTAGFRSSCRAPSHCLCR